MAASVPSDFAIAEPVARLTSIPAVADVVGMSSEYNRGYKDGYKTAYPDAYVRGYGLGKELVKANPPKKPEEKVVESTRPKPRKPRRAGAELDFGADFNDPESRFGIGRDPPSYDPYVPPPPRYEIAFGFPQIFDHRLDEPNNSKDQGLTWRGGERTAPPQPSVASSFLAAARAAFEKRAKKGSRRLLSLLNEKANRTTSV